MPCRHGGRVEVQFYSLSPSALDACGRSTPRSDIFTPRKQRRYPLYRRLCGPQGLSERFWRRENLIPLPRFEPQTIQPVTSHYTDYVIPARLNHWQRFFSQHYYYRVKTPYTPPQMTIHVQMDTKSCNVIISFVICIGHSLVFPDLENLFSSAEPVLAQFTIGIME